MKNGDVIRMMRGQTGVLDFELSKDGVTPLILDNFAVVQFQLFEDYKSWDNVLVLDCSTIDPTSGNWKCTFDPTSLYNMFLDRYIWRIVVLESSGQCYEASSGQMTVRGSITPIVHVPTPLPK